MHVILNDAYLTLKKLVFSPELRRKEPELNFNVTGRARLIQTWLISKFHFIQFYETFFKKFFPNIWCLKSTVNSNFHLI